MPNLRSIAAPFTVSAEVAEALASNRPVVALESTIISHGLPRPRNHEAAIEFEEILRDAGVTPATIAVLDGLPQIGLDAEGVRRISEEDLAKASVRDLPIIAARGASAATTVAATSHLAALAGIRVFATGGLGGVHRGANESFDESADLSTLAVTPITVVSAGVKSVLDIAATLERLETLSVPVIGFGTTVFPSFWLRESAFTLDFSVETAAEVAAVMRAQDELGHGQAIVVANPIPLEQQWEPAEHDRVLTEALALAAAAGVTGKAVTPFLLLKIVELSGGRSLEVNLDLARNNVRVAGEIAIAWSALQGHAYLPTGSIVLLVDGEQRSMFTERGANVALDCDAVELSGASALHVTGYSLFGALDGGASFERLIARAVRAGVPVSVTPGSAGFIADFGAERFHAVIDGATVLFPNLAEGQMLTGLDEPTEVVIALSALAPVVALTLGSLGVLVATDGTVPQLVAAVPSKVLDPTGAGDAFAAGFLVEWVNSGQALAAAEKGALAAASAIGVFGGRPIPKN